MDEMTIEELHEFIGVLTARVAELEDNSMSVCPHLTIRGLTKGMNRVYCASCDNEYWIPSKALGERDE